MLSVGAACASAPRPDSAASQPLESRLAIAAPPSGPPSSPPFGDTLTEREAVVLALSNSPTFRASLADIGVAEADLFDVRAPANPNFSLLDPVGSGVLEGAIAIPIDLLRRPAKVAAARARLEKATLERIHDGLTLARDVRIKFAAAALAEQRASLMMEDAAALSEIAGIVSKKAELGRGAGLDAAVARAVALDVMSEAQLAASDAQAARLSLSTLTGVDLNTVDLVPASLTPDAAAIPDIDALIEAGLATRPDVVAADLAVEAATRERAGAGLDVLQPGAIVDLGQERGEKLKVSGGGSINLPIFNFGQGARKRADAALQRAIAERDALRLRVIEDVASARQSFIAAAAALERYDGDVIPAAQRRAEITQKSFELGRAPLTETLLAHRALNSARIRRAETAALLRQAIANLNYSVGRELFVTTRERGVNQ